MTWLGIAVVITVFAFAGWRAWSLLRFDPPMIRAIGTVFSALAPIPGFMIVVAYHYAKRAQPRSSL